MVIQSYGTTMDEHSPSDPKQLQRQARFALALPILAWLSQVGMALFVGRAAAEIHLLVAIIQGLLILRGFLLGVWVLAKRGNAGVTVIIPAVIGVILSAGTVLLIIIAVMRDVSR